MEKYAVIQVSNGAFSVATEWTEKDKAIVSFHGISSTLWNAQDVEKAAIMIVNEKLQVVDGYTELIKYN